jgi:GT2 family glycosyltransferase
VAQAREVAALVRALDPQLVVAWNMRSALTCAVALRGLRERPRLLFSHNDFLSSPWVARAVRAAARTADRVVVPSAAVAADLDAKGALGQRLEVVRPGVDLERFAPGEPRPGLAVLVLGAIVPWKRQDLALEAIAIAGRELPELHVTFAGRVQGDSGTGLELELRRRASAPDLAGRVTFAGELEDPRPALRDARCLLHCAEREPYGLVITEALASGVPVVAPAAFGPCEIVDPTCGRLYPPGDVAAAATAVTEVLADPDMRAAARAKAELDLDVEHTRRRYRELTNELAAAPVGASGTSFAIVTVTHNSLPELEALFESIERHLPGVPVVVADSGSSDGSAAAARGWRGAARVLELGENVGFGRAVNAALHEVNEPVVVLLTPDTELVDDSLRTLAAEAARGDHLLTPLVLRPDGSRHPYAQLEPARAAAAIAALVPPAALPAPLARRLEPWRSNEPARAAWAAGCCVAARADMLRRIGPFDESIFLFGEDLELGLRAGDLGVETWFVPAARVIHTGGHSTERAFGGEPHDLLVRQRRDVMRRRRGPLRAELDDWLQMATFANRIVLKTLARKSSATERERLRALRRARRP